MNSPPSSYPTYPGDAPINLLEEIFSENSLMSICISLVLSPYIYSAIHLAVYVFPVPVAPTSKKLPTGLFGSCNPDLDLRMHSEISLSALD